MGYITDNRPETGNRQYGVDIRAHNENEILLSVVKQGNLNRKNWDADPNAVRQSLNDIQDTYIEFIKGKDREKKLRIIVATNGVIDEAARPSWEGYVSHNTMWSGMKVQILSYNKNSSTLKSYFIKSIKRKYDTLKCMFPSCYLLAFRI